MSLEKATSKVMELAGRSGGFGSTLKFVFDEGSVYLDGTGEQTAVSNENKDASCTIGMKLDDFHDMLEGTLNPMTAFMTGKFKIEGDMGVAMKLQSLFA
jgi:putative sterol carrier protein